MVNFFVPNNFIMDFFKKLKAISIFSEFCLVGFGFKGVSFFNIEGDAEFWRE